MSGAEPSGDLEIPEFAHRVVWLIDAPVILFQSTIEIPIAAADELAADRRRMARE